MKSWALVVEKNLSTGAVPFKRRNQGGVGSKSWALRVKGRRDGIKPWALWSGVE